MAAHRVTCDNWRNPISFFVRNRVVATSNLRPTTWSITPACRPFPTPATRQWKSLKAQHRNGVSFFSFSELPNFAAECDVVSNNLFSFNSTSLKWFMCNTSKGENKTTNVPRNKDRDHKKTKTLQCAHKCTELHVQLMLPEHYFLWVSVNMQLSDVLLSLAICAAQPLSGEGVPLMFTL